MALTLEQVAELESAAAAYDLPAATHEPLVPPFPYWGGKRRVAGEIWLRFGPVASYIEPFGGSGAVLLACPWGPRPREIWNDIDGFLPNFYRGIKWDPAAVAESADWPTSHLDLVARKAYCLEKLAELQALLMRSPFYFDPVIAGFWVWCTSNDIGLFSERPKDEAGRSIPHVHSHEHGGHGVVCAQSGAGTMMPGVHHRMGVQCADGDGGAEAAGGNDRPFIHHLGSGQGVNAQRSDLPDDLHTNQPYTGTHDNGRGVSAQRGGMPHVQRNVNGQGVSAQRGDIEGYGEHNGGPVIAHRSTGAGQGVQAQRKELDVEDWPGREINRRPDVCPRPGGQGVTAQRSALDMDVSNRRPRTEFRRGVMAQWDGVEGYYSRPLVFHDDSRVGVHGINGRELCGVLSGERLLPLFTRLSERLFRAYFLCKDWKTLCSRSVMGITPSDIKSGKTPYCGIFLDPPYATQGRGGSLYRVDSLTIALEVQEWAIQMGKHPLLRIAVCGYEDDYGPWPEGWTRYEWSNQQIRMGGAEKDYSRTEVVWFSPHCLPEEVGSPERRQIQLF